MSDIFAAAQTLIRTLNAPAQAHSVWVRSQTIDELDKHGEPTGRLIATGGMELCVSIRPEWKVRIRVPAEHDGHPVVNVPWPKGS